MTLGASDVGSMEKEHGVGKPIGKIPVLPKLPRNTITFEDIVPFTGKVVSSALEQGIRRGIKRVPQLA